MSLESSGDRQSAISGSAIAGDKPSMSTISGSAIAGQPNRPLGAPERPDLVNPAQPAKALSSAPREWYRAFLDAVRIYNSDGSTPVAEARIQNLYRMAFNDGSDSAVKQLCRVKDEDLGPYGGDPFFEVEVGDTYNTPGGNKVEVTFIDQQGNVTFCMAGFVASNSLDAKSFLRLIGIPKASVKGITLKTDQSKERAVKVADETEAKLKAMVDSGPLQDFDIHYGYNYWIAIQDEAMWARVTNIDEATHKVTYEAQGIVHCVDVDHFKAMHVRGSEKLPPHLKTDLTKRPSAPSAAPRYEYAIDYCGTGTDEVKRLNKWAEDGWSLVTVNNETYYFERLKAQEVE